MVSVDAETRPQPSSRAETSPDLCVLPARRAEGTPSPGEPSRSCADGDGQCAQESNFAEVASWGGCALACEARAELTPRGDVPTYRGVCARCVWH